MNWRYSLPDLEASASSWEIRFRGLALRVTEKLKTEENDSGRDLILLNWIYLCMKM